MTTRKAPAKQAQRTIAELAAHERELMAELAEVRVEISERAGQVDPPKPESVDGRSLVIGV
jgi:hypothetical protein